MMSASDQKLKTGHGDATLDGRGISLNSGVSDGVLFWHLQIWHKVIFLSNVF